VIVAVVVVVVRLWLSGLGECETLSRAFVLSCEQLHGTLPTGVFFHTDNILTNTAIEAPIVRTVYAISYIHEGLEHLTNFIMSNKLFRD
jgi:hypothetical protein